MIKIKKINFFRIIRTLSSEAYGIEINDEVIGRFDLHYATDGRIDSSVTILKKLSSEDEVKLLEKIDLDFVENAEINDDRFNITIFNANKSKSYGKNKE